MFSGRAATNSLPYRLRAMEIGITQAVALALRTPSLVNRSSSLSPTGQVGFPDLRAILYPADDSHLNRNTYRTCQLPMPPVFSQNRDFEVGNVMVLAPDFSFFTDFWGGYDHGTAEDIWFDVVEAERKADMHNNKHRNNAEMIETGKEDATGVTTKRKSSQYSRRDFEDKSMTAIFRGKTAARKFAYLRSTVTDGTVCRQGGYINATANQFVSRSDMCAKHQGIITLPGNGVWSWATKFNLVS